MTNVNRKSCKIQNREYELLLVLPVEVLGVPWDGAELLAVAAERLKKIDRFVSQIIAFFVANEQEHDMFPILS